MRHLLLVIILLATSVGCQAPKSSQASVRINICDEPTSLDPRKTRDAKGQIIIQMLFDGLMRRNLEGTAEYALAESVDVSEDLKTYTFHLKNSLWSNGDPVTASDFVYSWKTTLAPEFPSDVAFHLYVIKGGQAAKKGQIPVDQVGLFAKDAHTLVVELERPTPYFLQMLTLPVFFPINKQVDLANPAWMQGENSYVGNGPFLLELWKHQDLLRMKKSPSYWDAEKVRLASIELQMIEEDTELNLFEKKQLDWAGSPLSTLPVAALQTLKEKQNLHIKEMLGTYFVRINIQTPILNHPLIRKAFALALNRKTIVEHVLQGHQIPATGFVPLALKNHPDNYFDDGNSRKAKELFQQGLKELQLNPDQLPSISLLYASNQRNYLLAQALQQQWFETFGLRVNLEVTESKVYFDRLSKQDYQMALSGWLADYADPVNFLEVFKEPKSCNNTLWTNETYTQLLTDSASIADPTQRLQLLEKCEKILIEGMPIIPLFYYTMQYVHQPSLHNVVVSDLGQIDFKWAFQEEPK